MVGGERLDGGPRSVIVVGAGIVGLSTAWFLQERGVDVTVVDRTGVGAGASSGNAGWVAPDLTIPLNQPPVLRLGVKALRDPHAPLHIPLTPNLALARFLLQFALNCSRVSSRRVIEANAPLNDECIEAFDVLVANGVDAPVTDAPITAIFRSPRQAEELIRELRQMEHRDRPIVITGLSGAALREQVPLASPVISAGVNVHGQRFLHPGRFVNALALSVRARGATILMADVTAVREFGTGVQVYPFADEPMKADAAVIATGAWLWKLAERRIRVPVQAGRGYSFTVPVNRPMPGPIYLPDVRVACTPHNGSMRVAGTMEFHDPDDPIVPRRVEAIVASAGPLLDGVNWGNLSDVWVGSRPVTSDGRALIGEIDPGVFVAGGHGMWGLAHGPITGRLLAEYITTGKQPAALRSFDPLR
jgi:D-amino-acid dehydrogenase